MNKAISAHWTVVVIGLLLLFSIGIGYHNYSRMEREVVADLNRALKITVTKHAASWLCTDTVQTYIRLQTATNGVVSVHAFDKEFASALSFAGLKKKAGLQMCMVRTDRVASLSDEFSKAYLMSDTLLWLSPETSAEAQKASVRPMFSFRGYVQCSVLTIFSLSDQTIPFLFLLAAILWGGTVFYYSQRRRKIEIARLSSLTVPAEPLAEKSSITFGNLTLCCVENCFYDDYRSRLKLTPMQYDLLELFYLSPSHILLKTEICRSLWPGKENAEETLYTLIRRLKPVVEENSNLRITADRGRAYILEIVS